MKTPKFFARSHLPGLLTALALGGCTTIERPTAPTQSGALGPHTDILIPGRDTTIIHGTPLNFLISVSSDNGIDTIHTDIIGTVANYPPLVDQGFSVVYGVTVPTGGLTGGTVILRITTVDKLGQAGDTALRYVQIQ